MARIGEKEDQGVLAQLAGLNLTATQKDGLLARIKTHLDANYSQFKVNGQYTQGHIKAATTTILMNRG